MELVIAEKKDQATKLASPFPSKPLNKGDQYIEVTPCPTFPNGAFFVWAAGHLVSLADPSDYDEKYKSWSMENLPIVPSSFKHKVVPQKAELFKNIKKFVHDSRITGIISASDPGREGELIVQLALNLCGNKKPVRRLWTSSLTKNAVEKAFQQLLPGNAKLPLYHEALARQCADWVVGINTSRAYTIQLKQKGYFIDDKKQTFSTGRVQTPLLALIVQREEAIENFVSTPYWELFCSFSMNGYSYTGKWFNRNGDKYVDKIGAKKPAEDLALLSISPPKAAEIREMEIVQKTIPAPQLHSLSTLQTFVNKRFGMDPGLVLDTLQSLYLKGFTSYPRSDSQYVNEDEAFTFPGILTSFSEMKEYASLFPVSVNSLIGNKRYVDSSKVSDHYAIIPTENIPNLDELDSNEQKIYDVIAKSLIAAHQEVAIFEHSSIITCVNYGQRISTFITKGRRTIQEGWRNVFYAPGEPAEDDEDLDDQTNLPPVKKGDQGLVSGSEVKEGKTQPPKRYTAGDLINLMKTAGKTVNDKELEKILRDTKGLGTEATRAGIINTIKDKEYIEVKKNLVYPTEKGRILIKAVGNSILSSAEMTGKWEKVLADIGEGKANHHDFIQSSKKLTLQLIQSSQVDISAMPNAADAPKLNQYKAPERSVTKKAEPSKSITFTSSNQPAQPAASDRNPSTQVQAPTPEVKSGHLQQRVPNTPGALGANTDQLSTEDSLFHRAMEEVFSAQQVSVSFLQRKLGLGYTACANLIDRLETEGFIGPYDGTLPRRILITKEEYLKRINLNNQSGIKPIEQSSVNPSGDLQQNNDSSYLAKPDPSSETQAPSSKRPPSTSAAAEGQNYQSQRDVRTTNPEYSHRNIEGNSSEHSNSDELGQCPKCEVGLIIDKGRFYGCNAYQQTRCDWSLNKTLRGVEITKHELMKLLADGRTGLIKGFIPKDKDKPSFDAVLALKNGAIEWLFPDQSALKLPTYLLKTPTAPSQSIATNTNSLARIVESKCNDIKLPGTVTKIVHGPKVTRIELLPSKGSKNISSYKRYIYDFQAALLAKKISMYLPIPGQPHVGIEIPNPNPYTINLRQLLEDKEFLATKTTLTIPIGVDIGGRPVFYDLTRAPHLLIGGTTGAGKSVLVNAIITSLMYSCTPDEVRFILIDPKRVELAVYAGIPHLYGPIVNEPSRAVSALKTLEREMDNRYRKFEEVGTRNIAGYNEKILNKDPNAKKMPFIILIIDELADLMMTVQDDVEYYLQRMSQLARAAGIHIIVATQRPVKKFISPSIKALLPTRIAFAVASTSDSMTILDEKGAEALLGRGDMLFLRSDEPIQRLVSPFVSDEEVEKVVKHLKSMYIPTNS